jgi:hypothetical protein
MNEKKFFVEEVYDEVLCVTSDSEFCLCLEKEIGCGMYYCEINY